MFLQIMSVGLILVWVVVVVGCWLGWQLLRQNGRLLSRVEDLEQRLDELEQPPDELQGRARHSVRAGPESAASGAQGTDAPYPDDQASRFNNHSLAHSRIKRDGLKAGTPAPDFRLPRLDGRGELALEDLSGRRVLLVFSDPHCGPCNALAPELEKFHREQEQCEAGRIHRITLCTPRDAESPPNGALNGAPRGIAVVMISRGEPKENRAKVKEHGLTFPVVLQQQWEISRRYAMFATPIAYLIDESGVIAHDIAVGVDAIAALMKDESEPTFLPIQRG